MIFPSNPVRVLVSTQPVDIRKGLDGLNAIVSSVLRKDPFTGTVFVFRSRQADRLKHLYWDGTGLMMAYNHLRSYYTSCFFS
ncbi:IS66 family insertion sequence element accessory protein TnpB [Paracoccus benzoatiresistens]|uniref:IS66 family insertion sequence element accessory protein TnpB n=1 Tax=Paracoccus benzoatiresistens TaxID=2997341 RepID=A0ABT4J9Y3_9RHOB|nr:IS66 family insertion sequence element accessory protein TnpB [Paracoccus sp. EF6]MCZ0963714.1 IS66 family insertion sequence element accessory protein TnpB [Paracoccus sp. EF6]